MSAGLHVEKIAKIPDVKPQTPFHAGISEQIWNPDADQTQGFGISEGDEAKTLGFPKVVAPEPASHVELSEDSDGTEEEMPQEPRSVKVETQKL
jgi:hypothetical protein